jgi:hypothetical protein
VYASRATDAESKIIRVKELGKAALLFDVVGSWAQIDPFVLHGPPQAPDKDIVVAPPASVHADLDPVIPQHPSARQNDRPAEPGLGR